MKLTEISRCAAPRRLLGLAVLAGALLATVPAQPATAGAAGLAPRLAGEHIAAPEAAGLASQLADEPVAPPSRAAGATVARVTTPLRARAKLARGSRTRRVSVETSWSGQPTILLVLASATHDRREWVKVLLPDRPNGSTGWVPRDHVLLRETPYWVQISTRRRVVSVYRNGRLARRFRAVVGAPATPTPHGLAAIYERNRQPDPGGFVGPWVLSLTVSSEVLKHFEGGTGRVGIHGRAGASLRDPLGSARSHGCVRVSNRPVGWMAAHLPVGTPVRITG